MADENDNPSGGQPGAPARQLDLPFATPEEQAKFFDILMQLKAGTLKPEAAHIPILQLYDTSLGAWVRALGRSHPEIASRIANGMKRDLDHMTQNLETDRDLSSTTRSKGARVGTPRLGAKMVEILERERLVLETLLRFNEAQTLASLLKVLAAAGSDIEGAALTANLDRLEKDGVLERPRKGYYARNANSQTYLAALKDEIEARGSKKR